MKFVGYSKTKISVLKTLDNLSIEPVALDVGLKSLLFEEKPKSDI